MDWGMNDVAMTFLCDPAFLRGNETIFKNRLQGDYERTLIFGKYDSIFLYRLQKTRKIERLLMRIEKRRMFSREILRTCWKYV